MGTAAPAPLVPAQLSVRLSGFAATGDAAGSPSGTDPKLFVAASALRLHVRPETMIAVGLSILLVRTVCPSATLWVKPVMLVRPGLAVAPATAVNTRSADHCTSSPMLTRPGLAPVTRT
ncbi:hypothetical protein D3C72_1895340 [compost metagenome]